MKWRIRKIWQNQKDFTNRLSLKECLERKHISPQCFCRNEGIQWPVPIGWRFWGSRTAFGIGPEEGGNPHQNQGKSSETERVETLTCSATVFLRDSLFWQGRIQEMSRTVHSESCPRRCPGLCRLPSYCCVPTSPGGSRAPDPLAQLQAETFFSDSGCIPTTQSLSRQRPPDRGCVHMLPTSQGGPDGQAGPWVPIWCRVSDVPEGDLARLQLFTTVPKTEQ